MASGEDILNIGELYAANHRRTYRNLLPDSYTNGLTAEYGVRKWTDFLNAEGTRVWVACEEGHFLGFAAGTQDRELENVWYLDSLHVDPEARGRGVGTALIRTMGRYAQENGYSGMSICIVKGNDRAGDLYRKLGAAHWKDFEDSFGETVFSAEKLLWKELHGLITNRSV